MSSIDPQQNNAPDANEADIDLAKAEGPSRDQEWSKLNAHMNGYAYPSESTHPSNGRREIEGTDLHALASSGKPLSAEDNMRLMNAFMNGY